MNIKEETLAHYHRMIEWAKEQDPSGNAYSEFMYQELGESWLAHSCPLCKLHQYKCESCIVYYSTKMYGCRGTPWNSLDTCIQWGDWIDAALEEVEFLESLYWDKFYKDA